MLALPDFDHVERLQGRDDVFHPNPGPLGHVVDGDVRRSVVVVQQVQQDVRPVRPVRNLSQIRQGLFGGTRLALPLGQLVRETGAMNERQRSDAV